MSARQLPLDFPHSARYDEPFIAAPCNGDARAWLARTGDWPGGRLALWGDAGCGKSHLLHAWARDIRATILSAADLPVRATDPLAIDGADAANERALLHTLNEAAESGLPVLIATRLPPARWATRLPDLASRLRATTAVHIDPPDDLMLRCLLARLLIERQLAVPEAVQDWLLLRLPRTPAALRDAAAHLDRASLAAGRGVTRAIAETVLTETNLP